MKLSLYLCCSMVIVASLAAETTAKHSGHHHHTSAKKGYRHQRHYTHEERDLFNTSMHEADKQENAKLITQSETIAVVLVACGCCVVLCFCVSKCTNDQDVMDIIDGDGMHKIAHSPEIASHKEAVWNYYHKNTDKAPTAAEKVMWANYFAHPKTFDETQSTAANAHTAAIMV
eukprot:534532_1